MLVFGSQQPSSVIDLISEYDSMLIANTLYTVGSAALFTVDTASSHVDLTSIAEL